MPSAWKSGAKGRSAYGKVFTCAERAALCQLEAAAQHLNIQDGQICSDSPGRSKAHEFLKRVDACASMLNVAMVSRCYREKFTANYRALLSSRERSYVSEILVAGMSQASEGFLCVNGDMHPLTDECQIMSAALKGALLILIGNLRNLVNQAPLQQNACERRHHFREAFQLFDDAWVKFEKAYVNALIQIEAKSRAPLVEAIKLEKEIGTACGLQHTSCERFLDCLSNLIAKVQLRHRRTDDTFQYEVFISAKKSSHDHGNWVTAVLAHGALHSFEAIRKYLRTIESKIEHAHPDLHMNPGLVEKLTAMRQSWTLFEQWGRPGLSNDALNKVVAVAWRAMKLRSSFKNMCEECDPELFLVLPRILLLCYLDNPIVFQDICKKFLPGHLKGAEGAASASGKMQVLMHNFSCATRTLRSAHTKTQMGLASHPDVIFDILIQRAILGTDCDKHTLYDDCERASRATAADKVDAFMLELEGWSLELQRSVPEVWNDFTALFVACVRDEMPKMQTESFRV